MHTCRRLLVLGTLLLWSAARLAAAPTINTPLSPVTIGVGASTSFTVSATTSGGTLTYQWQGSQDGGTTWGNIGNGPPFSNTTTATIGINAPVQQYSGAQVRCAVTDSNGTTLTNAVSLTITNPAPLLILAQPTNKSAFQGDSNTTDFKILVASGGTVTYQWQVQTYSGGSYGGFTNIPESAPYSGTQTSVLSITDPWANLGGATVSNPNHYRCQVSNGGSYVINSKFAQINIYNTPPYTPSVAVKVNGSPASTIVSNDPSTITVQVSGVFSGGAVRIDRYALLHGGSTIALGDPIVQTMAVIDGNGAGSNSTFGGVTDPKIPKDDDGIADGNVSVGFTLANASDLSKGAGSYVFRVSSQAGLWKTFDSPVFTVTQPTLAHVVTGTVTDGTNPIGYARVALLVDSGNNGPTVVNETVANNLGAFTLQADPGQYVVLALAPGYVSNFGNSPQVDTTAGDATGNTLVLTPADYVNTVTLQDQVTAGALRGVQVMFQSNSSNNISMGNTDANGVAIGGAVLESDWSMDISSESLGTLAYLRPQSNNGIQLNKTLIYTQPLRQANALIYGTLKDATNAPLANVSINANDQNGQYDVDTVTDSTGHYYLPVYGTGGGWNVQADNSDPIFSPGHSPVYMAPAGQYINSVASASATVTNFVANVSTATLSGTLTNADNSNNPIPKAPMNLLAVSGGSTNFAGQVQTSDPSGNFSLAAAAGSWQVQMDSDYANSNNYVTPVFSFPTVTDGNNVTGIAYAVKNGTGAINGTVMGNSGPVSGDLVVATATINSVNYLARAFTDNSGAYSFPVINGSWTVTANNANSVTYTPQTVGVSGSRTVNFSPPAASSHFQGTVTNLGTPVVGVTVFAIPQGGGQSVQTTTDGSGNFDLGVNAGTFNISLPTSSGLLAATLNRTISSSQTISGLAIQAVSSTGTISGQVKDASNNGLSGVNVFANATINSVNYNLGVQTNGTGNYSLPVINGTWTVGISGNPNGLTYTNQFVVVSGSQPTSNTANFTPITFTAHFQGVVTNNGTPVTGLQVGANLVNNSSYPNLSVSATTDGTGHFDLAVLGSGAGYWNIYVQNPSGQNLVSQLLSNQTINDGQTISGLTLHVLTSTGTISGTVFDLNSAPVPNAFVNGTLNIGGIIYSTGTQANSSGVYSVLAVNGTWIVQPSNNNGLNFTSQNVIVNGSTATANFTATIFTQQPNNQTTGAGGQVNFMVQTNASGATMQWQVSTNGGTTWTNLTNSTPYSGVTNGTLQINPVAFSMTGNKYRCFVTYNSGSSTAASQAATLTVNLPSGPGTQPSDSGFVRPQFRRLSVPERITADQVTGSGKIYAAWDNGNTVTGVNNQRIGAVVRLNADGSTDSSFNLGSFLADAWAILPLANGQVLIGGLASAENPEGGLPLFRVFRFNSDGSRDTTFNSPVLTSLPRLLTLQSDGKVLVAPAGSYVPNGGISNLVRLNTDGSQDNSFTVPTFDGPNVNSLFAPMLVDSNGKILIGGAFNTVNGTGYPGVARLNADGSLDNSFTPSGFTRNSSNQVRGLGLQTQGANAGKILVAGGLVVGGTQYAVIRLNANGTIDGSFNLQGRFAVIGSNGARPRLLMVMPDDRFTIVSGQLARFNADGTFDSSYTIPGFSQEAFWMDMLADGTVLVPFEYATTVNSSSVISGPARFTPSGSLDGTFAPGPFQTEVYPSNSAVQPDGRILVWGNFDTVNTTARHGMARLNTDGSLDTFNLSGVANLYSVGDATLLPNGQILAATLLGTYQNSAFTGLNSGGISRFNSDGTVDNTFALDASANSGALHVLPSGNILTWNLTADTLLNHGGLFFERLTSSGAVDNSFVGLGSTAFGAVYRSAGNISQIVLGQFQIVGHYSDGRSIALATAPGAANYPQNASSLNFTLLRLNVDGTIDSTFTAPTIPVTTFSAFTTPIIDPQNTGQGPQQFSIVTTNGSPIAGVIPQNDGSVLVYGSFTSLGGNSAPGIARLTNSGGFDNSFSVGTGAQLVNQSGRTPQVEHVDVAPNGTYWVTGLFDTFAGNPAAGIVRLNQNGALDNSFYTDIAYKPYIGNGTKVSFGPSGEILVAGTFAKPGDAFPFGLSRLVDTQAPAINTQPQGQSVNAGNSMTLSVQTTFGLNAAYQWYLNGVAISGATSSTLTLTNIQSANGGNYTVTATTTQGTVTSSVATVTVTLNNQSINFNPPGSVSYTTVALPLIANATSGLPVSFTVLSGPATLTGNQLTLTGPGLVTVRASQAGNGSYNAAANADRTISVTKGPASVFLGNLDAVYDGSPKSVTASTNPNGLIVNITYNGSPTAPSAAGTYAVVATVSDVNYQGTAKNFLVISPLPGPGVEAVDIGFTRPEFRRTSLPGRIVADQVTGSGKVYAAWNNGNTVSGVNNQRIGAVMRMNSDGSLDTSFYMGSFLTDAWAILPMANGQVLVGGVASTENFESGAPNFRVFRFNNDGSPDYSYNSPVFAGMPRFMTMQTDGRLLVVPASGNAGNGGLTNLARLNADGTLDGSFTSPQFNGQSFIFAPPVVDGIGKILIGGTFGAVNGTGRPEVARLNSDGSLDTSFAPSGYSLGQGAQVRGLAIQTQGANAGKIIVVGRAFTVGSTPCVVMRLNSNGSTDSGFTLQAPSSIAVLAFTWPRLVRLLPDDRITVVTDGVTRLTANGALDSSFPRAAMTVESFWMDQLADGRVYVAPEYGASVNATPVSAPFRLTSSGALDGTFTPGTFQTEVYPGNFAVEPDGRVLIWGQFDTVNSTPRHGMALINTDGSLDSFNLSGVANLYSIRDAKLLPSGKILAATLLGSYQSAFNSTVTGSVSRFNSDGTVDSGFTIDASANLGGLHALDDGTILTWNLTPNTLLQGTGLFFERLAANGSVDNTFAGLGSTAFGAVYRNAGSPGTVSSIVQGHFEVGGHYADGRTIVFATVPNDTYPAGASSLNVTVLRLLADGTIDNTFNGPVVPWGTLSGFTDVLSDPLNPGPGQQYQLVSLNGTPFNNAIPQADGSVIIIGAFTSLSGHSTPGIARLTSTGAFDTSFNIGSGPQLASGRAAAVEGIDIGADGKYWLTGNFDTFNGSPAPGIARLNPDGSTDTSLLAGIAYRSYLGNGTKTGFGPFGEVFTVGTFAQAFEPFPFGLHRLVGTVAPIITAQPQSVSSTVGSNVSFSVGVTAGLTVAYQWYFNNVAIPGATNSTLALNNVQNANAGNYKVTVINAVSGATSNTATLSFGPSFGNWQSTYFTGGELGNPSISGPNAVYGQDGLPNLVKYALGLNPKVNVTTGFATVAAAGGNWIYVYNRPSNITDVTYAVEVSTDLVNWTTTGVTHSFVSTSSGTDTWQATYPLASAANLYFRLKITQP